MNLARVSAKRIHMLRRKFGIIFQDFKLIPSKTVFENVALVLEAAGKPSRVIQKKVRSVLRAVGMEEKANSLSPTLSGGEQQRVAIARAVAGDPKIILADEPTGSLDPDSAESIMELLKGFHTRGATVLLATHNKELASKMASRIIYLNQGMLEIVTPS
jgi:cell division transport system ATP-binding protein